MLSGMLGGNGFDGDADDAGDLVFIPASSAVPIHSLADQGVGAGVGVRDLLLPMGTDRSSCVGAVGRARHEIPPVMAAFISGRDVTPIRRYVEWLGGRRWD